VRWAGEQVVWAGKPTRWAPLETALDLLEAVSAPPPNGAAVAYMYANVVAADVGTWTEVLNDVSIEVDPGRLREWSDGGLTLEQAYHLLLIAMFCFLVPTLWGLAGDQEHEALRERLVHVWDLVLAAGFVEVARRRD